MVVLPEKQVWDTLNVEEPTQNTVDAVQTTDYVNIMPGAFIKKGNYIYFRSNKRLYKAEFKETGEYTFEFDEKIKVFRVPDSCLFGTFTVH